MELLCALTARFCSCLQCYSPMSWAKAWVSVLYTSLCVLPHTVSTITNPFPSFPSLPKPAFLSPEPHKKHGTFLDLWFLGTTIINGAKGSPNPLINSLRPFEFFAFYFMYALSILLLYRELNFQKLKTPLQSSKL